MATLSYTYPTLSNPADRAEVQTNFASVRTVINGGLDTGNLSSTAGLTNGQLANSDYEFLMQFQFTGGAATNIVHSTTAPSLVIGLPTLSAGAGTYTVDSASWFCTDVGDQTEDFTLTWGNYAAGTWSATATLATVTNITGTGGANTAGQGVITLSTTTLAADSSTMRGIGINFPNAAAAGWLSAATDFLTVSLKIFHANGLRAL